MTGKNIAGVIYSSAYDSALSELTAVRTMGSVPFGCRYRLIDFMLSGMVDFGMSKVGVVMNSNYRSLMDHIGTGRPWDLARKRESLFLLPPYNYSGAGAYESKIAMLHGLTDFLTHTNEEFVLLTDCNAVCNLNVESLAAAHEATGADITVAYIEGRLPALNDVAVLTLDGEKITGVQAAPKDVECGAYAANIYLMKKSLLLRLIYDADAHGYVDFERDILMRNPAGMKLFGWKIPGFCRVIDSLQSYFDVNMALLDKENRDALFCADRPIFTKVHDNMPTVYGIGSSAQNSLIADGCVINGTVINSILFRGARVEKGAVVKNSILMQNSFISADAAINCVIADKDVVIKPGKTLSGAENYPIYIAKGKVI